MKKSNWAIFVSGQGSNLAALIDQYQDSIALVVSSQAQAYAVQRSRRVGIATLILDKKIDWQKLLQDLETRKITHIFLAGFMKVIPTEFLKQWAKPILNVHPSLLPAYPGLNSVDRALADGAPLGATVHKVVPAVDAGDTVMQKETLSGPLAQKASRPEIEFYMHLVEYELVKKSFRMASCWM